MKSRLGICLFSIIPLLVITYGCGYTSVKQQFFDVPGYFRKQIDSLTVSEYSVFKTAVYNGDTSEQTLKAKEINWDKEFALFLESDINKPVYFANMGRLDWPVTETFGKTNQGYSYTANSDKLAIQSVDVEERNGQVISIRIRISKVNLISSTNINAFYQKGTCYKIIGVQKITNLNNQNNFSIEGEFK